MKKYGVIYLIKNKINNKIYIGQTTRSFDERYGGNFYKFTHNNHIKNSIDKYGIENFYIDKEFDIAYSKEELDKLEDMYIKLYKTTQYRYGYNKMFGGSSGIHTEEIKQTMREKQKDLFGVKVICTTTKEVFDTIADASRKYDIGSSSIISCCQRKISKAGYKEGRPLQWLYYNDYLKGDKPLELKNKRIICITTGEIFDNASECVLKYPNLLLNGISQCCSFKYNSHGKLKDGTKLQWMFYKDYLEGKRPEEIDERIICVTTNKVFNNTSEIKNTYNIDISHIHETCRNKQSYCGKLKDGTKLQWLYYKDYLQGVRPKKVVDSRIVCLNTHEIFQTIKEACDKYKLDKSGIAKCCNHKRKSCGKDKEGNPMTWIRYEEYIKNKNEEIA